MELMADVTCLICNRVVDVYNLFDSNWILANQLGLLQQLGIIPPPKH